LQIVEEEIKKIVIIRFKALGDILLTQSALRAVREKYPKSKIYMLVNKEAEDILSGLDLVDEIICFDKNKGKPLIRDLDLIERIMDLRPEMVIDLFGNMRSALISFLSGAKYRVGGSWRIRKYFYNMRAGVAPLDTYISDVMLSIVRVAGCETGNKRFSINVGESDKKEIDNIFNENDLSGKKIIGVNIFGTWRTKRWTVEKYLKLTDKLVNEGYTVALLGGGQKEIDELNKINPAGKYLILAQPDIKKIAEIVSRLQLLVTNDGFIRHIAVGLNKKIVTIIGPTNNSAITPKDYTNNISVSAKLDCLGCEKTACADLKCMNNVSVEQVYDVVKSLVNR